MKTICIIYNFAQKYREGIYSLIEREYNCHWVFGNNKTDIKGLDTSFLKSVQYVDNHRILGAYYYQKGVISLLKEYDTFLMLGELINVTSWIMLFCCQFLFPKKKLYLWSHGWYGKEGWIKVILKKLYFGMADATFLYGNYAEKIARDQGYTKDNLYVIHNSLNYKKQLFIRKQLNPSDVYRSHFENNDYVLIFIGRLTKVKKLDMLVDAVSCLNNRGISCNLVFVGDGSEKNNLMQKVNALKISQRVWFYGACYDEKKNAELIYNSDICISPGNVGLTAMHTMIYGTPVITHSDFKWQMPEFEAIKPGETGAFFDFDNLDSLVDCITIWLKENSSKREIIRDNCYREIDTNWTPMFQMNIIKQHIK